MAAAGLWTNPTELSRFIIEIQKTLQWESNKILSKEMTTKMVSPYLENGNTGIGFFIDNINGRKFFSHGGDNRGFKAYLYGSLSEGKGLVVMINSDNFDIVPEIIKSVTKVYEW